ncbi:hypothetical protein V7014_25630, partial [Bacillus sp. JJ722]
MAKEQNNKTKHPFMYIVQPDISIPQSDMQEQFRTKIDSDEPKLEEVPLSEVSDEIRIISREKVNGEKKLDKKKIESELKKANRKNEAGATKAKIKVGEVSTKNKAEEVSVKIEPVEVSGKF